MVTDSTNQKNNSYIQVVPKAWGEERWIVNREYCGKILILKKGFRCSYHCHKIKDETFYVNKGKVLLEYGGENVKKSQKVILHQGENKHIEQGLYHRFTGLMDSEIIEFSTTHKDSDSYRKIESGHAAPSPIENTVIDFKHARVLVIGDIMLDQYLFTEPRKISDEAPILVVLAKRSEEILGGAANVCSNLRSLGAQCGLISTIGRDQEGTTIKKLLRQNNIPTKGIFYSNKSTTKKMRIIASNQQMIRLDSEITVYINKAMEDKMFLYFTDIITNFDIVLLSDYSKGTLTPALIKKIISYCNKKKIKTIVDPRPIHTDSYTNASIITPNLREAADMVGLPYSTNIKVLGNVLQKKIKNEGLVLTLGADGMAVFEGEKMYHIKGISKPVYDVSGAGDTVVAVIAASISRGNKLLASSKLANIAGSIKVGKFGTATVSSDDLLQEISAS